jgi:RNA polymerase sigma-32 factor
MGKRGQSLSTAIDAYAAQVWKVSEPVSKAEEQELARSYRAGDLAAGNRLVMANTRYALKVAHEFLGYGHPLEDLVQEANLGMLRALRHFDPGRNVRFISYATWWIKAYLKNYCTYNVSLVRFGTTADQRRCFTKVGATVNRLREEHTHATDTELFDMAAVELGLPPQEAEVIYRRTHHGDESLQTPVVPSDDACQQNFQDLLVDDRPTPDERVGQLQREQRLAAVARATVKDLRERFILEQRLLAEEPLTLAAVATCFGVSRERIRQVEEHLCARIRAAF